MDIEVRGRDGMFGIKPQSIRFLSISPLRLKAESTSRPLTPSPLKEGGGGVAKHTSIVLQSYNLTSFEFQNYTHTSIMFQSRR